MVVFHSGSNNEGLLGTLLSPHYIKTSIPYDTYVFFHII